MTTALRRVALTVTLLAACGPRKRPAEVLPEHACPVVTDPLGVAMSCPITGCGTNSPFLNGFQLNELELDGTPNWDGVALVPKSLHAVTAACGTEVLRLDIENGRLVGRDASGIKCRHDELIGATFEVTRGDQIERITIEDATTVLTWDGEHAEVPAYWFKPTNSDLGRTVCPERLPWMEDWQEIDKLADGSDDAKTVHWKEQKDYAVLVVGETYDHGTAEVALTGHAGARWFNIACAGSALAKLRLLGYDPTSDRSTKGERQATLKMLTARYCGPTTYTLHGTPLQWESYREIAFAGRPAPNVLGPVEAYWSEDGVVCLSHTRVQAREATVVQAMRSAGVPSCNGLNGFGPGVYWRTVTVDHHHDVPPINEPDGEI